MHVPVLVKETLEYLNLKKGENVVDATLDGGGHAKLFLEVIKPNGKVLGIEQDQKMIDALGLRVKGQDLWKNLIIAEGNFKDIVQIAQKNNFQPDVIFFDLGMSTWHLRESGRGFSFQKQDEVLDMRMSKNIELTAVEALNSFTSDKLAQIFKDYGEERKAYFLAKRIVEKRKLKKIFTVADLIEVLGTDNPKTLARIFQALRIFVNDEINSLRKGIVGAFEILKNKGRIIVLSYHSLEDREVKIFFKQIEKEKKGKTLKKPIIPSLNEVRLNPSARSAKMRILWKI
ncbi:MAG TPA: 16S rRNA (cytosine(1402)-N(4))-methyltransferase RsmH [Candidatus Paceibacterota bacterium]